MGTMRAILRDRLLRGALAAFLGYFLVLQAFVGGFSSGAMAAAFDDAGMVICAPSGEMPPDDGDRSHDRNSCPCAISCQAAGLGGLPVRDAASILLRRQPERIAFTVSTDKPAPAWPGDLVLGARAPPPSVH